jgi:3-oxoacyl-[acyl-carrier protein] reductase
MDLGIGSTALAGRCALITGSSAGIGLLVGQALAGMGADVALNGRSDERGRDALRQVAGPGEVMFALGDCSRYEEAQRVVGQVAERFGRLDILVTAGSAIEPRPALFQDLAPDAFSRIHDTLYLSRVLPIHAALPYLRQRQSASIVMLGTDAGRHVTPGESIQGAIGAALILLTKALGRELARFHIRVNTLALTLTADTPWFDRIFSQQDLANTVFAKAMNRFPWGKPPTAEEVARAAVFLASDQSAQITGQTISVNGGLSFGGW